MESALYVSLWGCAMDIYILIALMVIEKWIVMWLIFDFYGRKLDENTGSSISVTVVVISRTHSMGDRSIGSRLVLLFSTECKMPWTYQRPEKPAQMSLSLWIFVLYTILFEKHGDGLGDLWLIDVHIVPYPKAQITTETEMKIVKSRDFEYNVSDKCAMWIYWIKKI